MGLRGVEMHSLFRFDGSCCLFGVDPRRLSGGIGRMLCLHFLHLRFSPMLALFLSLGVGIGPTKMACAADGDARKAERPTSGGVSQSFDFGGGDTMRAEIRLGHSQKFSVRFDSADGLQKLLQAKVESDERTLPLAKGAKGPAEKVKMPDASVAFVGLGLKFSHHIRPYLKRYTEEQMAGLAERWDTLPAASATWMEIEVRSGGDVSEIWLDGRFCGQIPSGGGLKSVTFSSDEGGEVRGGVVFRRKQYGAFLPLDVSKVKRPGAMQNATLDLPAGVRDFDGVPVQIIRGGDNADVGVVREMQGPRFLETNENTSRTALDGMPESIHFSVPQAPYTRAWVLCAVEADRSKEAIFTTRLTRFAVSGRGGAIADTLVELPREGAKGSPGVKHVGNVDYADETGGKMKVPLYLVPVDLKVGSILDLLAEDTDPYAAMKVGPYLDFEFLGRCGGLEVQNDHRRRPLKTVRSGVHIFGATLEVSGVGMRLKQSQPGNIFHNDEKQETGFVFRSTRAGQFTFVQELRDVDGRSLRVTETPLAFAAAGLEREVRMDLATANPGWFALSVRLLDETGRCVLAHEGSMASLGKDTRQAGYESPYGTWWFGGAHYTTRDLSIAGPMLMKAGFRRVPVGWTKDTEADFAPWKVTLNQIGWSFRTADLDNWSAAEERVEKVIREKLDRFPNCRFADIFHESFDNVLPPEIHGDVYEAKQPEREEKLFELAMRAGRFMREKFPQLKLLVGNSGGSAGTIAMLMRRGYPRNFIDYLGSETTGQTIAPERLMVHTTAGLWILRETARRFGHDIPLAGCYEFTCRAERDMTPETHAEWYTRDVLFGLAYRFPTISPGELEDAGNAYYDSFYGAAGLCERKGLWYPKRAYVAMATLTKVLDRVELLRLMPTGSLSAHALEFRRGDSTVYAVWTPRGECEMEMKFPEGTAVERVDFYGKTEKVALEGGRVRVTASPAVCYVVASARASVCAAGARKFPRNERPATARAVVGVAELNQWQLGEEEPRMKTSTLRHGKFSMQRVVDEERGACLELELKHEGTVPDIVGEYATLRLTKAVPIEGNPHTMGVWLKGDSSGGRVYWEVEDAKGERWISNAGYDGGDWGNHSAIDFDGWCYVTFPIGSESPATHLEPGRGLGQWKGDGDGKLDLPLKLKGIYVETHRKGLDVNEMRPVSGKIRIQEVGVLVK